MRGCSRNPAGDKMAISEPPFGILYLFELRRKTSPILYFSRSARFQRIRRDLAGRSAVIRFLFHQIGRGMHNFPTVEQLALAFLEELRKIQAHGPYQLCGYSKAGLVAYEIARLLLSEGEEVPFLALFETWHPGYERNLTRRELVQFRLLHIVDRLEIRTQSDSGRLSDTVALCGRLSPSE